MKPTAEEFLVQPRKRITLIGMSGAGKSYLADKMAGWGWVNYSCDDLIGTQYLKEAIDEKDTSDPMKFLSAFVGKIGSPEKGGLDREAFRHRQKLYYEAECSVLRDMDVSGEGRKHFVNDSSGSLCEIADQDLLAQIGQKTLFVYLKIGRDDHEELVRRAVEYPKPLYFPPVFLEKCLGRYRDDFDVAGVEEIDPDEFLRWVFPHLFESRLPKYQALADQYGVSIPVGDLADVSTEDEFLNVVARALDG